MPTATSNLSSLLVSALYKLRLYGEIRLDENGMFSRPDKYWTITRKEMAALERAGHCRIETVGESTFATYIKQEPKP